MEQIRYVDYPEGKRLAPFQALDGDSYFMVTGYSFTYLGSYEEIGNIQDPWEERSGRKRPGQPTFEVVNTGS